MSQSNEEIYSLCQVMGSCLCVSLLVFLCMLYNPFHYNSVRPLFHPPTPPWKVTNRRNISCSKVQRAFSKLNANVTQSPKKCRVVSSLYEGSKTTNSNGGGVGTRCSMANYYFFLEGIFQLSLPLIHHISATENRLEVQRRVLFDSLDLSLVLAQ